MAPRPAKPLKTFDSNFAGTSAQDYSDSKSLGPLTLCSPAIPGESFVSQVARYHVASGNPTTRDTYMELFQRGPFRLTSWVSPFMSALAGRFEGDMVDGMRQFLRDCTLFPLFAMFSGARLSAANERASIERALRTLPQRMVAESGWTRLCPACLSEDEADYGTPAIRSAHQIPGISRCFRHGTALLDRCLKCRCPFERVNDLVLVPWFGCSACKAKLVVETSTGVQSPDETRHADFAIFTSKLLASNSPELTREGLVALYKSGFDNLGMVHKGRVDRTAVTRELISHFGDSFVTHVDPAYRSERLSGWFQTLTPGSTWEAPLGRHLLLSYFIYEDADRFLAQYHKFVSSSIPSISPRVRRRLDSSVAKDMREDLMSQIQMAASQIPQCSLDHLWQLHYGIMKRLLRQDAEALVKLEKHLAKQIKREATRAEYSIPGTHPDDTFWAQRLRQMVSKIYESQERPRRASRNQLLILIGWKKGKCLADTKDFPEFERELEAWTETAWHFYLRRLLWTLAQPGARTSHIKRSVINAGIEWHRGVALGEFCSKQQLPDDFSVSKILATIRAWGIDPQWIGPSPERVFANAGRDYKRRRPATA